MTVEVKKDYDPLKYSNPKIADNKDVSHESRPPVVTREKVKEHVTMQFEDVPLPDNAHDLEVNSMVEFTKNEEKLYGVMRWMGYNPRVGSMAGIELVSCRDGSVTIDTLLIS